MLGVINMLTLPEIVEKVGRSNLVRRVKRFVPDVEELTSMVSNAAQATSSIAKKVSLRKILSVPIYVFAVPYYLIKDKGPKDGKPGEKPEYDEAPIGTPQPGDQYDPSQHRIF